MPGSTGFNALIVALVLLSIFVLCAIAYWSLRKRRQSSKFKFEGKLPPNGLTLKSAGNGHESTALLKNKDENLRDLSLVEVRSSRNNV